MEADRQGISSWELIKYVQELNGFQERNIQNQKILCLSLEGVKISLGKQMERVTARLKDLMKQEQEARLESIGDQLGMKQDQVQDQEQLQRVQEIKRLKDMIQKQIERSRQINQIKRYDDMIQKQIQRSRQINQINEEIQRLKRAQPIINMHTIKKQE